MAERRDPYSISARGKLLVIILVVLIVGLSIALGLKIIGWPPSSGSSAQGNPVFVTFDGIHRNITYRGNWTGYFGPEINDTCTYCPIAIQTDSAVELPIMTLGGPQNLTYTIFYNITGPFLMLAASCSGTNCTIPWVTHNSFFVQVTYPGSTVTLYEVFLMPETPLPGPNIIQFNATICPASICPFS